MKHHGGHEDHGDQPLLHSPCSYDTIAATRRAAAAATASAAEVAVLAVLAVPIGRWQRWHLHLIIRHEGPPLGVAIEGLHGQLEISADHRNCSQLAA